MSNLSSIKKELHIWVLSKFMEMPQIPSATQGHQPSRPLRLTISNEQATAASWERSALRGPEMGKLLPTAVLLSTPCGSEFQTGCAHPKAQREKRQMHPLSRGLHLSSV